MKLSFLALILSIFIVSCGEEPIPTKSNTFQEEEPEKVFFIPIDGWNIYDTKRENVIGRGRVILIGDSSANFEGIKKLGKWLSYNTKDEDKAFVTVFKNSEAAKLHHLYKKNLLNKKETAFCEKNLVAVYNRNKYSDWNEIQITLNGLLNEATYIKY